MVLTSSPPWFRPILSVRLTSALRHLNTIIRERGFKAQAHRSQEKWTFPDDAS